MNVDSKEAQEQEPLFYRDHRMRHKDHEVELEVSKSLIRLPVHLNAHSDTKAAWPHRAAL